MSTSECAVAARHGCATKTTPWRARLWCTSSTHRQRPAGSTTCDARSSSNSAPSPTSARPSNTPCEPGLSMTSRQRSRIGTAGVTALELPRTFWEKATILHAEHHRPAGQTTPDRYARHYSNIARLLGHCDAGVMLADHALCARVVERKSRVFARQWALYDLAKPGTFQLLPPTTRLAAVARDYAQMRAVFLSAPPEFDALLGMLDAAERTLNAP